MSKNYLLEFVENEKVIENIFNIKELKGFNLNKYYDLYIVENRFKELESHGFQKLPKIPVDIQYKLKDKIRKRIEELVKLRICLLEKIKPNGFNLSKTKKETREDFILDPFDNVLNTQENINNEINKQIKFLI